MTAGKRPAFPARLDLKSGAPAPARSGLPPMRRAVAQASAGALAAKAVAGLPGHPGPAPVGSRPPPLPSPAAAAADDGQARFRRRMAERLAQVEGIRDARVLRAMATVERHRFVDTALRNQAYEDTSLPIGLNQTISKPSVVARMIELLCQGLPAAADGGRHAGRLLEIGTGCGYQAAVLGQVAREVYSMERLRGLHEKARENLRPFRIPNVHLLLGDGMLGYPKGAPYAGIIAAAGGNAVPQAWLDQLAVGGRLVAPMVVDGSAGDSRQALLVLDKTPAGLKRTVLEAVHFVPLKSGIA